MKPKFMYVIILAIVLSLFDLKVKAQNSGCDLCGPSSGSYKNIPSGTYSATIGYGCDARGPYSFAIGCLAKSYMPYSISIGKFVMAKSTNSMVIGCGNSNVESKMLVNKCENSLMIGFNSIYPTLFVSSSSAYNKTGKVAIGNVILPKAKLHLRADVGEDASFIIEPADLSKQAYIQLLDENNKITVQRDSGMSVVSKNANINLDANKVLMNAQVTINAPEGFSEKYDYALAVSGGIMTSKVLVKEVSEWYDHVFEDDYKLLPISNVEQYIDENGHLPDMPSEKDVLTDGYDMVVMDGLLLRKIEELTLYAIELNNQIKHQQKIIESLQSK